MNEKYITLFKLIAQTLENTAETAMASYKVKKDLTSYKNAKEMRENYAALSNVLSENKELDRNDFINLLIGATIITGQLESKILAQQKALTAYREDLIPKLNKVIEAKEDFAAKANEIFVISES